MRILIHTIGTAGDTHPFVMIGSALRAAGHKVFLLANEVFEKTVEEAGLEFVPCGDRESYESALRTPGLWESERGLATVWKKWLAPSLARDHQRMVSLIDPKNTAVVGSTLSFPSLALRETHGIPLAMGYVSSASFRSLRRAPRFLGVGIPDAAPAPVKQAVYDAMDEQTDGLARPDFDPFRASLGLKPVSRLFTRYILEADARLALFPPWFAPPERDWPSGVSYVGFPLWTGADSEGLEASLSAWLDAGPPPVVVTAGSTRIPNERYYRDSLRAARQLGLRALVVSKDDDVVPRDLSSNELHVRGAPYGPLFRRAAAVIHHAGIGTTGLALAAGVPAVAVPLGYDQLENAARLEESGAGISIPLAELDPTLLQQALSRLLHPSPPAACRRAAGRIAAARPLPAAVEVIERMARASGVPTHRKDASNGA